MYHKNFPACQTYFQAIIIEKKLWYNMEKAVKELLQMRTKRLEKFRRYRRRKARNYVFFTLIVPSLLVFLGYIISSLIILPFINK